MEHCQILNNRDHYHDDVNNNKNLQGSRAGHAYRLFAHTLKDKCVGQKRRHDKGHACG